MRRILDFLRTDDLPRMTRPNFVRERSYFALWMAVVGAVEGNLAAIVAKKTFGASDLLTSIVWAAPIVMMSLNVFWGVVIRGRRRLPLLYLLTSCGAVLIASVTFTSPDWHPWGGWMFALQIAATHVFVTALVTLQASIWQMNYPASHRGRIVGRLQTIRFLAVPLSGAIIATLFDWNPDYYRFIYPAVGLVGLLSLLPMRRYRVRGERRERRELFDRLASENASETQTSRGALWNGLREAGAILRDDPRFRRYMIAQFTLGAANFFTDPVLVTVLTGQLMLGYLTSNLIMQVIPGVMVWLSIRFWSGYFDRVGVLRFRVMNSGFWIAAYTCVAVSMLIIGFTDRQLLWIAIPILICGRMIKGASHGGGTIAWSIGHLHFARPHQIDLYMSIHVALTGLRALVMPLLGSIANHLVGNGSFAIAVAISIAAFVLFRRLARNDPDADSPEEADARRRGPTATDANVT
jgi:hypothetical protein